MGTDAVDAMRTLPCSRDIKVHRLMCLALLKVIDSISKIFPQIEAARPRSSSGLQALCLLNGAIEKAKSLLQQCSESSKLYLAITGDAILSRCKRARNLLEQSLCQVQSMVPVRLAAEISPIISDLGAIDLRLDPSEEEAGKVVLAYVLQYESAKDSTEKSAVEMIQFAALRLSITSQKALLIEKRSIKKLLAKIGDGESTKKRILLCLLNSLKKYGQLIVSEQKDDIYVQKEDFPFPISCNQSVQVESRLGSMPPEEFKCPISLRLMFDPVTIASGQTFEKTWIQKWFNEGNDTCPQTGIKLAHLSFTLNSTLKDLISKWCLAHGVTVSDPLADVSTVLSWETFSTPVASLSSSMNGSSDRSYGSDSSSGQSNGDSHTIQYLEKRDDEVNVAYSSNFDALPWESQCKAVVDVKIHLEDYNEACLSLASRHLVEQLVRFLKDARDLDDVEAQRNGFQLLCSLVSKCRRGIQYLDEDACTLLASFLNSEITEEALAITELLSRHHYFLSKIAASGTLISLLKILDNQIPQLLEPAIRTLDNVSSDSNIRSLLVSLDFIPRLVRFLGDTPLSRYCIRILRNLCENEVARNCIAETDGCIASIVNLLEIESDEDEELAVGVLLSLCSQCVKFCRLVMDEGVIPALVRISNNGNDKGKASAVELLRILKYTKYSEPQ